jgi:Tfp pilus assembly protein PilN
MFTIDLLRGQGIPMKRRPWGVAIVTMTVAVPIFVAMVMLGFYLGDRIVISVNKQAIIKYEKYINTLSDAVKLQQSFEKEKDSINSCLSEALSSIGKHTQWSPILATIVRNMPNTMILTSLEVKQRSTRIKVPRKDDPEKMIDVSVPVRTLRMSVSGRPQANNDKAVKDFMDRLRSSALLASKLEDVKVSQKSGTLEGQNVVSYEIDCVFKPAL